MFRERLTLWLLLASTFAIRAVHPGQAIVENYVGRQIPTAMVARNLERGSGFLHPQLDTGPFPNLFLVEPPIYAQVVAWLHSGIGFDWEPTGRLISSASTTLAAWGLFGLARRREGVPVALLSLASFALFPVMIRYGRAFQPDALMLGCVLAGLRGWDEYEANGRWGWAVLGGFVFSVGLALKITTVWALLPFWLIMGRWRTGWKLVASLAMLGPALAWYLHAGANVVRPGLGSMASADNAGLWLRSLSPESWLKLSTYDSIVRGLTWRSFTPVGFVLGIAGLVLGGKLDRVWKAWALGCGLSIVGLASKWHHAYYWMVVAPLIAVGVGRALVACRERSQPLALVLGSSFAALALVQTATTWKTPPEWASLAEAGRAVASLTTQGQLVAAPEALLYYSDRRGFRLEFDPAACRRAAGEWAIGEFGEDHHPLKLVEFYQSALTQGRPRSLGDSERTQRPPLLVADVGPTEGDPGRRDWRSAVRGRPNTRILIDRPALFIAELH